MVGSQWNRPSGSMRFMTAWQLSKQVSMKLENQPAWQYRIQSTFSKAEVLHQKTYDQLYSSDITSSHMLKLWMGRTWLLLTHLILLPPPPTWYTNSWQHGQICGAQNFTLQSTECLVQQLLALAYRKKMREEMRMKMVMYPLLHLNTPWLCHKFSAHLRQVSEQFVVWNESSNSQVTWDQGNWGNSEERQTTKAKKNSHDFIVTEYLWSFFQIIIIWKHPF